MTREEEYEALAQNHLAMLELRQALVPIFDAADGMRVDLERRGWSSHVAEGLAAQWLSKMMQTMMQQ